MFYIPFNIYTIIYFAKSITAYTNIKNLSKSHVILLQQDY